METAARDADELHITCDSKSLHKVNHARNSTKCSRDCQQNRELKPVRDKTKRTFRVLRKEGRFNYQVEVDSKIHLGHIDQMRSIGSDNPLSSPDLKSSFRSIPEVSTPSPSDKELPVFPAPTVEVEPTPRPAEPKPPTAMTPELRSEPSTVHKNTAESVPTAVTLRRNSRVRKATDGIML
ncbi:hypothetical protein AVEN_192918-1 [Araneus ventricosus]|uniref:Uncharacterized protein n=1 Tax=Araneus ventricosus TaxID=182803 RepID=A0A4Y2QZP2_ARAVE|nr:hypothetical protein AVEN_192918-1 [Araneus ventricosus]